MVSAHAVQFYEHDAFLVDSAAEFVGEGLDEGHAVVVIATERHLSVLDARLAAFGIETQKASAEDRYLVLDAADMLGRIIQDDRLDPDGFTRVMSDVLRRAARASRGEVCAFGEMVALLWEQEQQDMAIQLERLWNDIARTHPVSLRCAYPLATFDDDRRADALRSVCEQHSEVIPAESFSALRTDRDRDWAIAELQRKARALEIEVAQRREVERVLRKHNLTQRALIEASPLPIAMIDPDATVRLWNPAAERLFGWGEGEVIGRKLPIVPPDKLHECICVRAAVVQGDHFFRVATQRMCRDGSQIDVLVSASPVIDNGGAATAVVLMFEDVTERNQAEAQRQQALRESEAANRAKDEFLAMLGHELRNPLASLSNAVLTASFDPDQREPAMQIARRGIHQLVRLVDDLLDVARITQGRIPLHRSRLSLRSVLAAALEAMRSMIEQNSQLLVATLPDPSLEIDGDATRLEQVFVNLLSNATKYTDRGGRIEVSVRREGGDAVVRVADDGIGIHAEMIPRIFDLFAQADRALDRAEGGLGIGLTIVRRLVELHGGRVEATSPGPGKGASFEVRFPTAAGQPGDPTGSMPAPVDAAPLRVLLVEDNPDAAESLSMLLGVLGHRVRAVHDGTSALEVIQGECFDLVLMDIGLPGMDGYEVARRVREEQGLRELRLVALTGYGRDEDRQRALEFGFDLHLVKPVDPRALKQLLASVSRESSP